MASAVAQQGSGTVPKMYRVKPFFDTNAEIVSNVAMYKVKKFESDTTGILSGGEEQVPERVRKLEQRQEKVLQELQKLQQSVQAMAQQRGVNLSAAASPTVGAAATSASSDQSPLQNGKLHDLVISADPSSAPLSLLVLLKQLSTQCQVLTSTFVHSSATDTPEKLRAFLHNGPQTGARSTYQLAVTVVWKKIANGPRMMVSPTRQTYVEGEANIARYLSRLLQPAYDSSDAITATQIDELLDLSQQQILGGNNKERSAALRTLNARLGKAQWLVGASLSVADVVVWSAVQGARLGGDAPANVKKWLKACGENELFQEAVKFLPPS
ncbi:aminoacyl tRNA synthase complex-interacting multifunctional protein 2-like isoform X2 [Littorina saxatilis]|uniref:AIMP2 thioredoxin-like domain-containing protein n=1 Tax=Littorina saxatilis TaxID=31220 RepID=A0AAN9BW04_9CAEN